MAHRKWRIVDGAASGRDNIVMAALAVDTLKLAKRLEAGGFSHQQAVTAAEAMAEVIGEAVVTQGHLDLRVAELRAQSERLKAELQLQIEKIRADLTSQIEKVRADLTSQIEKQKVYAESQKVELLKWLLGALIAQTGLIVALVKLIPS